jgi:hypothetical protein
MQVFSINVLSELVLIEPSKAHVLPGVGSLERVVLPLSHWSSALSRCLASLRHGLRAHASLVRKVMTA